MDHILAPILVPILASARALPFAASYIALLIMLGLVLGFRVVQVRRAERISLGDNDNPALRRRIRAHGNFSEYAPLLIGALVMLPLLGAPELLVHLVGATGVCGRIVHAIALTKGDQMLRFRVIGMVMTITALAVGALALPVLAWR